MGSSWSRALCAVAAAWAVTGSAAMASPWNRDDGEWFVSTRNAWFSASGGEADLETRRDFKQASSEIYAEYGLTRGVQLGGKLSYGWQQANETTYTDTLDGLIEAKGLAQVQLTQWEGGALAIETFYAAATSTTSRLIDGRRFARDAQTGVAVLAGGSNAQGFAALRVGADLSLGDDAHSLQVDATLGKTFGPRTMVLGEAFLTQSLGGADGGADFSVLRAGPSIVVPVWGPLRAQIGGTVDIAGTNVDLGTTGFVAFWMGGR